MGEVKKKTYMTATEAREAMLNSISLKNYIYRNIKECAYEGRNTMTWDFYEVDPEVYNKMLTDLIQDGYKVEENPFDDDENKYVTVRISW